MPKISLEAAHKKTAFSYPEQDLLHVDPEGVTYLHFAAMRGEWKAAQRIITAGVNVNVINKALNTPLHIAALHNQMSMVKFLLSRSADKTLKNNDGETAEQVAIVNEHFGVADYIRTFVAKAPSAAAPVPSAAATTTTTTVKPIVVTAVEAPRQGEIITFKAKPAARAPAAQAPAAQGLGASEAQHKLPSTTLH